jgi:uncharacterized protein YjiS (DUF1127 family)
MTDSTERQEAIAAAMWPAQNLVERLVAGVYDRATAVVSMAESWRHRNALAKELTALDDHQLEDLGITREQIPQLVSAHPEAPALMQRMMQRFGVAAESLADKPELRRLLQQVCNGCFARGECKRWLRSAAAGDYPGFCPNAPTFAELAGNP